MEFSAIIAEYNPLTNGHIHHIKETKEKLGLPIVCIMSGNFVQRGEIAVLNKYTRAKHAILAGADIVIELPTIFSLSSAQDFAYGAIKTLSAIGSVKYLSFGSELGDIEKLKSIANELIELENQKSSNIFSKSGKTYASNMIKRDRKSVV
jgi:predicted nucleotidyltransferase